MAAANASNREPGAADRAVIFQAAHRVARARRLEPTDLPEQRRKYPLINPNQEDERSGDHRGLASVLPLPGIGQTSCAFFSVFPGCVDGCPNEVLAVLPLGDDVFELRVPGWPLGDDDQVHVFRPETARRPKCFPDQALRAISHDGVAHLARDRHPESRAPGLASEQQKDEVLGRHPARVCLNPQKLRAFTDALLRTEAPPGLGHPYFL